MNSHTLQQHRQRQDQGATLLALLVAGLGLAGALWPLVEHVVTAALAVLVGLVLLVALVRRGLRLVRERREDAADVLAGAAWRAAHLPHLVPGERARAGVA